MSKKSRLNRPNSSRDSQTVRLDICALCRQPGGTLLSVRAHIHDPGVNPCQQITPVGSVGKPTIPASEPPSGQTASSPTGSAIANPSSTPSDSQSSPS